MIGQDIAHFRILEKLGQGGMGEVFLAEDLSLHRKVALKFLLEASKSDSTARKRLLREARSAAGLDHPFICKIYEIGDCDGRDFIAMEYVPGQTLKEKLSGAPLPLNRVVQIASEIAEALELPHRQGIVHRDLKPANILMTEDGHVKVTDFGLARQIARGTEQSSGISSTFTQEGALSGTLVYMSPEQLRGEVLDPRSDIFSFGVMLCEMLTGVHPFMKPSVIETANAILNGDPPSIARFIPEASPLVEHTIRKMLAKDPELRYQSVHEVRTDLAEWEAAPAAHVDAETPPKNWRRMLAWSAACCALTGVLAGVAAWHLKPAAPGNPVPVTRLAMALPQGEALAQGVLPDVAFSPDGAYLAYAAVRGGKTQIYLRTMDQVQGTPIPGTEEGSGPFFSPDGKWLGFFGEGRLKKVSLGGGAPVILCSASRAQGAVWGSDDAIIYSPTISSGLYRIKSSGGNPEVLTTPDFQKGEFSHRLPELLPGGKALLYVTGTSTRLDDVRIVLMMLDTGKRRILIEGGSHPRYVPTGHLVYARQATLMAVPFDLTALDIKGTPAPILDGVFQRDTGAAEYSFCGRGWLVYATGGLQRYEGTLAWVDRAGAVEKLGVRPGPYTHPRLSPDGRKIVMLAKWNREDLWVYDIRRRTMTPVTSVGENRHPIWTPDGKRLIFQSTKDGPLNLYWQAADGSGTPERLTTSEHVQSPKCVTPDGSQLIYIDLDPETGADLWMLSLRGDRKPRLYLRSPFDESSPQMSPDGRWLAYASNESGRYEIYVRPFPDVGGKWQISADGGNEPLWSPDGRDLFFRRGDQVWSVGIEQRPTFAAGSPRLLFEGRYLTSPTAQYTNYDVARDGKRFLMIQASSSDAAADRVNLIQGWFDDLKRIVPPPK